MVQNFIEPRLRIAGVLVLVGLLVEAMTLWWSHPVAFLVFLFIGFPIALLGVLLFLYSLLSAHGPTHQSE